MFLTGIAWGNRIDHIDRGPRPLILSLSIFSVISFLVSELTAAYIYIFVGRLLGSGIAGLPGLEETARRIFHANRCKGEQLEFGVCFWCDLGEIRWAVRSFFWLQGRDRGQFFFSRLGLVLLRGGAIYSRTSDNKWLLPSLLSCFPFYLKCLSNSSPMQGYPSLSGTSSIWQLWVTTLTYNLLQRYVVISLFHALSPLSHPFQLWALRWVRKKNKTPFISF